MTKLWGCFPAIIFTVRVDFAKQYYYVWERVYNKILSHVTSISMLQAKTSGKLHQIMVSTVSHCVMFLYWGKCNLVALLQREFLFRWLCCVCRPRGCWKYQFSRPVLIGCVEIVDFVWWNYGCLALGKWRLLQRKELCRCVWELRLSLKCPFYIVLK